jgi:Ca2+-dependent lipid-binding protein
MIEHEGILYKTRIDENGGLAPKWNEMITIRMRTARSKIRLICFDEDLIMDSCVGETTRLVEEICGPKHWERLYYSG